MVSDNVFEVNQFIDKVIANLQGYIASIESTYEIPHGYLKTYLALHLFKFSTDDIYNNDKISPLLINTINRLAEIIKFKISNLPSEFKLSVLDNYKDTKLIHRDGLVWEVDEFGNKSKITFNVVTKEIGDLIEENLNYIGQSRKDNLYRFGFYRENEKFPFAYASFAVLERRYLYNALPVKNDISRVLVMTRAFNTNNSASNTMSLLFCFCDKFFIKNFPNKYDSIITAVNPNLLFKGSAFRGASFHPISNFPFLPLYYKDYYITRKAFENINLPEKKKYLKKRNDNIPIKMSICLGHGLTKEIERMYEYAKIKQISQREYEQG